MKGKVKLVIQLINEILETGEAKEQLDLVLKLTSLLAKHEAKDKKMYQ